jgi:adenine-specific DNA-methyltransferase
VFESVGEPYYGTKRSEVRPPEGCVAAWPIRSDGSEGRWQVSGQNLRVLIEKGYARLGSWREERTSIIYLKAGEQAKVESGTFPITDRGADNSIRVDASGYSPVFVPGTQWRIESHNAEQGGTNLLKAMLLDRKFPFPKSLYAVEDALRFYVSAKRDGVILDFFAGSGTTVQAVMRLNKQDGGRRRSICITNNEVSADEQAGLISNRLRPGDPDWEQHGICEFITKPRIETAITGLTPSGQPIKGDYKFTDEFPMADGLEENVEFFRLTYEAPLRVASNREFTKIAPLLWMRAGSRGRRIGDISAGWDVADNYGVLADLDHTEDFLKAIAAGGDDLDVVFIVTDEDRLFEAVARELPEHVEPVRLYEAYLRNFEIEAGRGAL